jgi:hypothetical protein
MDRACSTNGEQMNLFRISVRKPERKRPLGRTRRSLLDHIEMNLKKRQDEVVWTGLIWLRIGTGAGLL